MHLLVTGSSGLIGTALVDAASARGDTVTRLVRTSSLDRQPRAGVTDVTWDPAAGTIDTTALAVAGPFDGVVHLAGAGVGDKRWSDARKREIIGSRTRSTDLLARSVAALDPLPEALVSASGVGYYGDRGDELLTEASSAGTGFLAGVCVAWEAATAPAADAGIRTVILRTGFVLSARGGALGKQLPLFRFGLGGRLGSGRQYRSWITLDDEVAVILHCLGDAGQSGPVNATTPHPVTDGQLAKALGRALHRPSVLPAPAFALKIGLGAEMTADMLLSSQRALPGQLARSGFTFSHSDLDEALRSVLARS